MAVFAIAASILGASAAGDTSASSTVVVSTADPTVDVGQGMTAFSAVVQDRTTTPPVHVTWEDVPDSAASPHDFPPDYLKDHLSYGITFATIGAGRFRVSAGTPNVTATPSLFGDIDSRYPDQFIAQSPSRIFAPLDGSSFEIYFFDRTNGLPAMVDGFGAVFTGVDLTTSTTMEFFHGSTSLGKYPVPPGRRKVASFLGVVFGGRVVSRVVVAGAGRLGDVDVSDGGTADVFALDDLFYQDPVASAEMVAHTMHAERADDVVTYSTLVQNTSPIAAQRVYVRQTFAPDVHVISVSPADQPLPTVVDGVVTWYYESTPGSDSTTYEVVVGVDSIGLHPSTLTVSACNDAEDSNNSATISIAPSGCVDDGTIASLSCRLYEFRAIVDSLGLKKSVAKPLRNPIGKAASQTTAAAKREAKGRTAAAFKLVRAANKTLERVRTALYSKKSQVIAPDLRVTIGQRAFDIEMSMLSIAGQ
jgi:uncharacterized repeat protein (TIGR01451 family)